MFVYTQLIIMRNQKRVLNAILNKEADRENP